MLVMRIAVWIVVGMVADMLAEDEILAAIRTSRRRTSAKRFATPPKPSASVSCRSPPPGEVSDRQRVVGVRRRAALGGRARRGARPRLRDAGFLGCGGLRPRPG